MRLAVTVVGVAIGSAIAGSASAQPALSPPGETPAIAAAQTPAGPELDRSTLTGQVLLGGVLGLGGGIAGGYLSYSLACGSRNCSDGAIAAVLVGAYASASFGIAGGTYLVGNSARAEGSFGAAFGGALVGGVAGLAGAAIVDQVLGYDHPAAKAWLGAAAIAGGWIGGSLVGYYLTRHWKPSSELARVRPTFHAGAGGVACGIGAAF